MARKIANDESPEKAIQTFRDVMDVVIPGMMDESDIYIFTSYQVLSNWMVFTDEYFKQYDFVRKALLVWEKDGPGMGDLDVWGMGSEFILYFKRGKRVPTAKRRNNVFRSPQVRPGSLIHPHEKPTPLLEQFIKYSTEPGEFLVDPFGGSGSLVRAARNVGRSAVAIEYDEFNYDLAKKALEEGNQAMDLGI